MPLMHSKKPSAFVKNIKTEIHAGKPQKQAVAIAYSVKRDAEKHKYAKGGSVKGVHEPYRAYAGKSGESYPGFLIKNKLGHGNEAKTEHEDALKELKMMPNPKLKGLAHGGPVCMACGGGACKMAEGGEVDSMEHESDESPEFELSEMAADELMEAIHSKDKEKLVSAMKALIAACQNDED